MVGDEGGGFWGGERFEGFEWDRAKSAATERVRGFDVAYAARVFDGPYREQPSTAPAAGEQRFVVTGQVEGDVVTVVWTPRGRRRRIIAAWLASRRERREDRADRALHERGGSAPEGPG